ncbi:conserved hypothetical protein [Ricinus communis]|uniref:Uncharacterized protein n=1 Tax=Ricinus communis TaxID=3988 RepID=B9SHD5_RICCO|nr:conserved hypothetical protein [Ricinus communis]
MVRKRGANRCRFTTPTLTPPSTTHSPPMITHPPPPTTYIAQPLPPLPPPLTQAMTLQSSSSHPPPCPTNTHSPSSPTSVYVPNLPLLIPTVSSTPSTARSAPMLILGWHIKQCLWEEAVDVLVREIEKGKQEARVRGSKSEGEMGTTMEHA